MLNYFAKNSFLKAIVMGVSLLLVGQGLALADFANGGFEDVDPSIGSPTLSDHFYGWTKAYGKNNGVSGLPTSNGQSATTAEIDAVDLAALGIAAGGTDLSVVMSSSVETGTDSNAPTLRFPRYGSYVAQVNHFSDSGHSHAQNVSTLTQQMVVTTADIDPADGKAHVRFAVAPVLNNGSHAPAYQPYYYVNLRNVTKSSTLYHSFKYAMQNGVNWLSGPGTYVYTNWQLVDVGPGPGSLDIGDTVELEVVAAGCQPGGHEGYVYVDGIGSFLPGLAVSASGPEQIAPGGNLTYTLNYRNGGLASADSVIIKQPIPTNTTYVGVSDSSACSYSSGTVTCNVSTLTPNSTGSFQVTVQVGAGVSNGTTIANGNYTIEANSITPIIGPLVQTTTVTGGTFADLESSISDGLAATGWGDNLVYTATVTNNGPVAADGATITTSGLDGTGSPLNLTLGSWTCVASGGAACGNASGSGALSGEAITTLPAGGSVTFSIAATVASGSGSGSAVIRINTAPPSGVTDNFSTNSYAIDSDSLGTLRSVTVNKTSAGAGTVTSIPAAINCGTSCSSTSADFVDGSSVSLSAAAAAHFSFTGWNGAGCSGTGTCTFSPSSDTTVSAEFECEANYYGSSCAACPGSGNCSGHGTCADGISGSGACTCAGNYGGSACDSCAAGYYGATCSSQCPGSGNCSGHGTCSDGVSGSGVCTCSTGFAGTACDECASGSGLYGASCTQCPGDGNCSGHGTCSDGISGTGVCTCATGFTGTSCSECLTGRYGSSCTQCPGNGNCNGHGTCSDGISGNGACECSGGFTGSACENPPAPSIDNGNHNGTGPTTTGDSKPTIDGAGHPGSTIEVYVDGILAGSTTVQSNGSWSFQMPTELTPGAHAISAYQKTESGQSQLAAQQTVVVTGTTILDFDGDGVTDVTTTKTTPHQVNYRWESSYDGKIRTGAILGTLPVPGDYDGDGKWDYAAVSVRSGQYIWRARLSSTRKQVSAVFGRVGDIVLSGCRLVSGDKYAIAVVRGRSLRAMELTAHSHARSSVSSIGLGDLLGCGDVLGTGRDQAVYRVPGRAAGQNGFAVLDIDGTQKVFRNVAEFPRGLVIKRPGSMVPIMGLIRGVGTSGRTLDLEGIRGAFEFPLLRLSSGVNVSNGIFVDDSSVVNAGVLWQNAGSSRIYRLLLASGAKSHQVFRATSHMRLTKPINVYRGLK